jgi:hypothetical protein
MEVINMFKKIGVILLLIICAIGFSMSSVSAASLNKNYNLTIGEHFNVTIHLGYCYNSIGDALDYVDVITHHPNGFGSHILEFVGKKVTPEGKPAQFRIYQAWHPDNARILSFEVKE